MAVLPIEVKSGKDFSSHKALDRFLENKEYNITSAIVLDNEREVYTKDKITCMPIYFRPSYYTHIYGTNPLRS